MSNRARRTLIVATVLPVTLLSLACGEDSQPPADGGADAIFDYVSPGKADDYRSTMGREYLLVGTDTVSLSGADADLEGDELDARVRELVEAKFKAQSFFVYAYLASKSSHDDNYAYGGFRTTIRQQTFESLDVSEAPSAPGTYAFLFQAEAGGPRGLLDQLPIKDDGTFDLVVPVLSNAELESGSYSSRYRHFNPADWDEGDLTTLQLEITPQQSEPDAYPEYNRLFEDGLLDVAIHVGGDYNEERHDLATARDLFDSLQSTLGLEPPVATYEDLKSDSGPFVGSFDANGRSIDLQVFLYHPDMNREPGVGYEGLLQLYEDSASTRDIVIYDGHAGYDSGYSGVVVHYNPRFAIPADNFQDLDLPSKYQIFVMNGCKTYTVYADSMYRNPNKDAGNLDIITTVNFSWLSEMTRVTSDLLGQLVALKDGTHAPKSYDRVLAGLNQGQSWDVIYGVHGLGDNPRRSPYADEAALCASCRSHAQCPGADNICIRGTAGDAACGYACTDDSGCPDGYACRAAAQSGSNVISTTQCIPVSGACE